MNYLVCGDLGKKNVTMVSLVLLNVLLDFFYRLDLNYRYLGRENLD